MSDTNLQPLREMAAKWKYSISDFPVRDLAFQDAAEELFAWCDAAEAWLVEQYPYATKTRRVLIGSKP